MRKLLMLLFLLFFIPLAFAIEECGKIMQPSDVTLNGCQITSTWKYPQNCSQWIAVTYNASGFNVENFTYRNQDETGYCITAWNITTLGSYNYAIYNNTGVYLGDTGNILIQGDKKMMNFTVIIFLIALNLGVFFLPVFIKSFTNHQATDYVLRHLVFMLGTLFLWLNVTILNQMAHDAGLGLDTQLSFFWWFMTLVIVIVIFAMVFVTTMGMMKMLKESELKKRMGEDG